MTQTNRCWTVMVYMAGDNGKVFEQLQGKRLMAPMEEQGYKDIEEMEAVGSTPEVAVLVQFDTLSNREHTYRIYIRPSNEPRIIENIPEQNTGDPRALTDFIVWAIENYPAENYAVIMWNHGTGWKEDDIYDFARNRGVQVRASQDEVRSFTRNTRLSSAFFLSSVVEVLQLDDEESRAIAFDDSSLDFLDNAKLQQAFQEAEAITGKKEGFWRQVLMFLPKMDAPHCSNVPPQSREHQISTLFKSRNIALVNLKKFCHLFGESA